MHQLPGRVKYSDITLKNGITYSHDLWLWFRQGLYDGKVKKMAFSIVLGNAEGLKVKQWEVLNAFPKRWKGPTLQSGSADTAVQEITLAHHGLTLEHRYGERHAAVTRPWERLAKADGMAARDASHDMEKVVG